MAENRVNSERKTMISIQQWFRDGAQTTSHEDNTHILYAIIYVIVLLIYSSRCYIDATVSVVYAFALQAELR